MANHDDPRKDLRRGEPSPSASPEGPVPAVYVREAQAFLAKGKRREAYDLLQPAIVKHAGDPFLLSYFGYLAAAVEGKYRYGIESCARAILLFEKISLRRTGVIDEKPKAVLYLNLGRAYLAGDRKKEAFEALQKGRRSDARNRELLGALEGMGVRKFTPLPFLDRSNPLNVLVGRMLRKTRPDAVREGR